MNRSLLGLIALLATACGGDGGAPPKPASSSNSTPKAEKPAGAETPKAEKGGEETPAPKNGGGKYDASMGTATVSGKASFKGEVPVMGFLDMSSDAKCGTAEIADETVLVGADNGLANVVISVSKGAGDYKFEDGTGTVTVDQKGCQYIPHVVALQAGQTIAFTNSDDTVHNVHSYSKRNTSFNQAQTAGAPALEKKMARKDKLFAVKCDMHSWMNCHVAVFDHPFFTVSDADGNFTLPKLPPGKYTLTAEHEMLKKQTAEVTVTEGGTATASFIFSK